MTLVVYTAAATEPLSIDAIQRGFADGLLDSLISRLI